MNDILDIFFGIVFGTEQTAGIILEILFIVGLFRILQKSGINGWWALCPFMREVKLAKCASREQEGKTYFFISLAKSALLVISNSLQLNNKEELTVLILFFSMVILTVHFISWIYMIRIFLGLVYVYDINKKWMILFSFSATRWIGALILGFSKKMPLTTPEMEHEEALRSFSNEEIIVMDKGLSVDLRKRTATDLFQTKTLLRDIKMNIQPGHMVLLLGGSGAGKTTFMNAINGYEKADAKVLINGKNVYEKYREMKYEVGYVPQQELMRGKDTVYHTLDDAALLRLPSVISSRERLNRVQDVMRIFGLSNSSTSLVEKMSGGQKKRLSIAMEYLSSPQVFILDEPDSGLDGVMARNLMNHLRAIADQGKIVIVITHTPDRVIDLFDDVIVLAKDSHKTGRLAFFGSVQEAYSFFGSTKMEEIVMSINSKEEGGKGLADSYIQQFAQLSAKNAEVQNG